MAFPVARIPACTDTLNRHAAIYRVEETGSLGPAPSANLVLTPILGGTANTSDVSAA